MMALKRAALELSLRAGMFRLAQRANWRRQAAILTFHRFAGGDGGCRHGLPIERLDEFMRYLVRHFRVVSLDELSFDLRHGVVRPSTVVVTVDDGYRDMFTLAAPVFRQYKIPASLFVVSDFVEGGRSIWTDRFRFVFEHAPRGRVEIRHYGSAHVVEIRNERDRQRQELRWRERAKGMSVAERDDLLGAIARAWRIEMPREPLPGYRALSWAELRALAAEGFDVGGHTRTHPILSRISPHLLRDEIAGCKEMIEHAIGVPVRHFAYPNGRREDYSSSVVMAVAKAGYAAAVTSVPGGNTPSTSPYELDRIGAEADDLAHFAQYVSGFEQVKLRALAGLRLGQPLRVESEVLR
jgi:peptidoglycan/xylan/chitin deacetylase (PgdA/CDA1 family)